MSTGAILYNSASGIASTGAFTYNDVSGSITLGTSTILSSTDPSGNPSLVVNSNIIPTQSNIFSLGTSTQRWKEVFVGPGTLNIAGPTPTSAVGKIGTNANSLVYTENGFATPFINVGPAISSSGSDGGWRIDSSGSTLPGAYNLNAQQNDPSNGLIRPVARAVGNTRTVDAVYGNDTYANASNYAYPFKTISAALLNASGHIVIVNAGIYNETLTIPDNASLSGTGAQAVIIQQLNVSTDKTLITMGVNSRVENITANLTATTPHTLTGIRFPTGTSTTAKLRACILTVSSTVTTPCQTVGILSDGSDGAADYTAANAIQRSTINVLSDSSGGVCRGIYVHGYNRFSARDIVVYARGAGNNIIGVETDISGAYADLKTSTISGTLYDVKRTAGEILLGFTDLRNSSADGTGFSAVSDSNVTLFGVIGNLAADTSRNLVPGTLKFVDLPATPFLIPVLRNMILFMSNVSFTGVFDPSSESVSLKIYKNGINVYTNTLVGTSGLTYNIKKDTSVDFKQGDTYYATLTTVGNLGSGDFVATLYFY